MPQSKRVQVKAPLELGIGDRVPGHHLVQAFTHRIVGLSGQASHRHIEIRFDQPVDVIKFESFSSLRTQIRSVVDENGCSHRHTSDGASQLIVERETGENLQHDWFDVPK